MNVTENIQIGFRENRTSFRPGDEISGAARWELENAPKSAEVRLCWFTRGKGTEDAAVVRTFTLENPQPGDVRTFSFRAPFEPYSFSGKLISLIWCVELVMQPGNRFQRAEIIIAPEGQEVLLLEG